MDIFISETDRQLAKKIPLRNIAHFFGIKGWDIKENDALMHDISALDQPDAVAITKLLINYFKAYDNWFLFYQKRKVIENESGIEYNLTHQDKVELSALIKKRENTLAALQEKFDQMQLKKYNRGRFGTDLTGIIYPPDIS